MANTKYPTGIEIIVPLCVFAAIWFFLVDIDKFTYRYAHDNIQPIPIIGYGAKILSGETEAIVIGPYPYPCGTGTCSGVRIKPGSPTANAVLSSPDGTQHWVEEWSVIWGVNGASGAFRLERSSDQAQVKLLDKNQLLPAFEK